MHKYPRQVLVVQVAPLIQIEFVGLARVARFYVIQLLILRLVSWAVLPAVLNLP